MLMLAFVKGLTDITTFRPVRPLGAGQSHLRRRTIRKKAWTPDADEQGRVVGLSERYLHFFACEEANLLSALILRPFALFQ